jgi:hypothetical protein
MVCLVSGGVVRETQQAYLAETVSLRAPSLIVIG